MVPTIIVHGSDGKVMAPLGRGEFLMAKPEEVIVSSVINDPEIPLSVREALVGLKVRAMFTAEQLNGAVPEGSRVCYVEDLAESLVVASEKAAAEELLVAAKLLNPTDEHHFVVLGKDEFTLVP